MVECEHVWDETTEIRDEVVSKERYGEIIKRGWVNKCVKCGAEELRSFHTTGKLYPVRIALKADILGGTYDEVREFKDVLLLYMAGIIIGFIIGAIVGGLTF